MSDSSSYWQQKQSSSRETRPSRFPIVIGLGVVCQTRLNNHRCLQAIDERTSRPVAAGFHYQVVHAMLLVIGFVVTLLPWSKDKEMLTSATKQAFLTRQWPTQPKGPRNTSVSLPGDVVVNVFLHHLCLPLTDIQRGLLTRILTTHLCVALPQG